MTTASSAYPAGRPGPSPHSHDHMQTRWVTVLAAAFCAVYGMAAAFVFVFSGTFGEVGQHPLRTVALILISLIAALALTYISLLLITYLRSRPSVAGREADFTWHFLIPCRDEESVVAETVSAARASFPHAHVWVIDDASEDTTADIVTSLQDFDSRVHLVSRRRPEARTGKGDALNAAYAVVSDFIGDQEGQRSSHIIGVLDADGYLSDNALDLLAGPHSFGDDAVGAAQLEVWMKNRGDRHPRPFAGVARNLLGRFLVRMQDIEFRTSNSAMQLLRVQTGTVGMGGNGQFVRLSVLDHLAREYGQPWGKKLSEDYELGLNILSLGYRNHYIRDAHVSQEALPFFRRLLTQRTRWGQGNLECASNLPVLRKSRALTIAGFLEIHYFMVQPWLLMVNLILGPALLILAIREGQGSVWESASTMWILLAALIFVVLPYALWGVLYRSFAGEPVRRLSGIVFGLGYLFYVYMTYFYYPRAIARMLTGRNAWAKTRRNADDLMALGQVTWIEQLVSLPLLDDDALAELSGDLEGHEEYTRELVMTFAIVWPKRLANVREALAAESDVASRDAVASLRVASQMLGAARLAEAAQRVTEAVEQADYRAARGMLSGLAEVGSLTVEEIRARYVTAVS